MAIRTITLGIMLVFLLAGVGVVSANLVTNGGFEEPKADGVFTANMNTGLTGWTIESGNIDLIATHWDAYEKDQSIDLSGNARATISQQIVTDPSQPYYLSFALSGNPYSGDISSKIRTVEVYWDDDPVRTYSFDTSVITSQTTDMQWVVITIPGLQATSSGTPLKFKDVSPNTDTRVGVALDDIVVDIYTAPPVPEFPSIALPAALIVGLIGAVLFIQKSKEH